jgi:RNA recognition motif-containing protein
MGNRLYVGNLPVEATEKQIRSFIEGEGRTVTSVKIVTDRETGRSRGFAFVDLENADQAQKAVAELNGKDFGGRALVVNEAQDKGPSKAGSGFRSAFADKEHARDQVKGGFGSRGPMQQMPRGSQRGGGRGGTRGS